MLLQDTDVTIMYYAVLCVHILLQHTDVTIIVRLRADKLQHSVGMTSRPF
jgi:hypothetical protein